MHLLASEVTGLDEVETAIDLEQDPADVVVLSFADSDLTALAAAWSENKNSLSSLRLASLKQLKHPMSVDLYIDRVISDARAVVVRCLGGLDYWRYGLERIADITRRKSIIFAALPGDDRDDSRLAQMSSISAEEHSRLDQLMRAGGRENAARFLSLVDRLIARAVSFDEPVEVQSIVGYRAGGDILPVEQLALEIDERPTALIVFYRAALLAADTDPIAKLSEALEARGLAPVCIAVSSLKDPSIDDELCKLIAARKPAVILNATAFSALREGDTNILNVADVPVLQVVLSGQSQEGWEASPRGLNATDMAMNVVLPELDGRLFSRAISFKAVSEPDPHLQFGAVRHTAHLERVSFVAKQAEAWAYLHAAPNKIKRLALVMSDYPARAGRAGYAVGLDSPRSLETIVSALAEEGYDTGSEPLRAEQVEALIRGQASRMAIPIARYEEYLAALPALVREEIAASWGAPAEDPSAGDACFTYPIIETGRMIIALQPDRGAPADRKSAYHDLSLPPRHSYLAFYWWLREERRIDAMLHLGTHGTLEWLPGKAVALSQNCWPEVALGPLPVVYPFIVNNPGEAVQAKRRVGAVTIGHLTPPLSAAGLSPQLAELEALIEEYAEAEGMDRGRVKHIESAILDRAWESGLAVDYGITRDMPARQAIEVLDAQLCDLKELSIRDRLHVFGVSPEPDAEDQLVAAIGKSDPSVAAEAAKPGVALKVRRCGQDEIRNLIAALAGRRVPPGPAGAPSRGRVDVLPTGRNLTTTDPRAMPTRVSATIGQRAAEEVIRRYLQDHGEFPNALMVDLWASAALRTGGDDLAQALHFLGVRPVWDHASSRVTGIEVLPLAKLGRPRIDVTLRVSGLFRDIFENQIALFDLAVRQVAARDETDEDNPLAAASRRGQELWRIFGSAPGSYGAASAATALDTNWADRSQLGQVYLAKTTHAFGSKGDRAGAGEAFRMRVIASDALVHGQDDRETDMLAGDGYADYIGGFAAAAAALGVSPELYQIDTSRSDAPMARRVSEEITRLVRARLANPRWINGMLEHGARGVAEVAQAVDALYAFQASAEFVPGHLFDLSHSALLADAEVLRRMQKANPAAVRCIAERFHDLILRRLWSPRRNAVSFELEQILEVPFAEARCNPPEANS